MLNARPTSSQPGYGEGCKQPWSYRDGVMDQTCFPLLPMPGGDTQQAASKGHANSSTSPWPQMMGEATWEALCHPPPCLFSHDTSPPSGSQHVREMHRVIMLRQHSALLSWEGCKEPPQPQGLSRDKAPRNPCCS